MTYSFLLFAHLMTFAAVSFLMGTLAVAARRLRDARNRSEAQSALTVLGNISKGFPVVGLALLGTGGAMAQERWSFGEGWVIVGIAALIAMALNGALIVGGRERALQRKLTSEPDDSLSYEMRKALRDRVLVIGEMTNFGLTVAVAFIMVLKTPLVPSIFAALACAIVAGGASAVARPSLGEPTH